MQKPEKPTPDECCGSGCLRCVYDIYVDELKEYRRWKKQQDKKSAASNSTD